MKKNLIKVFFVCWVTFSLFSCGGVKYANLVMMEEVQNELNSIDSLPVLTIRADDILSIQVASRNPETVLAFHRMESRGAAGEAALSLQEGYRVDEAGNIYLPFLGTVKAVDKSIMELREEITEQLQEFIPDASVQIRYLNFRVTLLGEVNRPNTYIIPNERLTILEAIGMAGDFTPYATRSEVLVIRERSGNREFARINTQDKTLFLSPYFYLSPNDIIYVQPLKAKQYATQGDFIQRYASVLFPLVTLATFFLGRALN